MLTGRALPLVPESYLYDPKHWRDRAEETRVKAGTASVEQSRMRLRKIAQEYDRLAELAERMSSDRAKPQPELARLPISQAFRRRLSFPKGAS